MKDNSRSQYQATLEKYGLRQKPVRHYFEHGSISFSVDGEHLWYTITITTKTEKSKIRSGKVGSKQHLDKLLAVKKLNDLLPLELVIQ